MKQTGENKRTMTIHVYVDGSLFERSFATMMIKFFIDKTENYKKISKEQILD
jgi:hypothetical protein